MAPAVFSFASSIARDSVRPTMDKEERGSDLHQAAFRREKQMITRRHVLLGGGALGLAGLSAWAAQGTDASVTAASAEVFPVMHSSEEWRKLLTPKQYAVLREGDTEMPFTSALLNEHRAGMFACAGCDLDLFSSTTKYDSRTGWPSFWTPLERAVEVSSDRSFGMIRTEVHCSRCGGHLGHVFNDGPKPTGLRYCMNGVAMTFKAEAA
jgi:peptide-methionine (R)-S-oxide reductase